MRSKFDNDPEMPARLRIAELEGCLERLMNAAQVLVNKNDETVKAKRDCVKYIIDAREALNPPGTKPE